MLINHCPECAANNLCYLTACQRKSAFSKKPISCIEGCRPCRRARALCDGQKPSCTTCEKQGLNCADEEYFVTSLGIASGSNDVSPNEVLGDSNEPQPPSQARKLKQSEAPRAKLACLACRRYVVTLTDQYDNLPIEI